MQGNGDSWAAGDAYEAYMGRWSRLVAREFLAWLRVEPNQHWLEVGCGSGALTATIQRTCAPASIVACDQSAAFVEHARSRLADPRVSFVTASADALPNRNTGFDVVVSGLVLNFIAEPRAALAAMRERLRPGGLVGAYVWDYSGGIEFLRYFWEAASSSDRAASGADESHRFADWQPSHVAALFRAAGLVAVETATLAIPTHFANFGDYWQPFLGGTGPAPSYVAALTDLQRNSLEARLRARLPSADDGSIRLQARAFAIRGARP